MDTVTSELVKVAKKESLYVGFAQVRDGVVVYRDSIRANTVEQAIERRFPGGLPDGFVVEKVIRTPGL